jgi:hypothetical protein
MNPEIDRLQNLTRRSFLKSAGQFSLGAIALASMTGRGIASAVGTAANPLAPRKPHFEPKVKRVIYLHMSGGPPHLDLFDYKPELVKWNDKPCPDEFIKGRRFAFTSGTPKLMGTPHTFAQYGKNGIWMSDAIPHFQEIADELCVIKSLSTDQFNHTPAELLLFTGSARQGRPSMGSWVTYGLGSENENLPGFVVLISSGVQPSAGPSAWAAEKVTVGIGGVGLMVYLPTVLAKTKGYFAEEGLDVEILDIKGGGSQAASALIGGSVDFSANAIDHAIKAKVQKKDLVAVHSHVRSLYQKLDAHSLTEAIARARELGLMDNSTAEARKSPG